MSNAVATKPKSGAPGPLIPQSQIQDVDNLDLIVKESNAALIEASQSGNELRKAIIMAKAIPAIKAALMPLMDDLMELMDTPLGFKTDRPPGTMKDGKRVEPYTKNQVADVLTIGLLRGFRVTLNEINIISAQFYGTKEGYERLLKDLPGLTDLRIDVGVPTNVGDKGAVVNCKASWKYRGTEGSLICEGGYAIPVKMNAGMGTDAAQGKATSKMLRRIYKIITNLDPGGDDDEDTVEGHIVDQSNTKQAPGT
jgi:hypothetical protein